MCKGVSPDHASTEQLVLKLRWSHAGMQRESEVNVQLIRGLNAILYDVFLDLLFVVLLKM